VQAREVLDADQRHVERVLLETRLVSGLDLAVLADSERARVDDVVAKGLAVVRGDRLVLTQRGRLLADGVVRDLLD
jgi:coproporphyrinogen III oxidase-like Fe-S oxidoreductase